MGETFFYACFGTEKLTSPAFNWG